MSVIQKPTNLDDVLAKFGMFKPYHRRLIVLFGLAYASNAAYSSNYIFAAEEISYSCKDEYFANNTCRSINFTSCKEWVYANPMSFVGEFQLACQDWKRTLVGTIHSLAYMVGLLFVGPMSDKIGRKAAIVITGILGGVIGLARSFSAWYWMYIALEFLESAIGDSYSPLYILNIETIATKRRVPYYFLSGMGFPLGGIFVALTAWRFPYWRDFLRVIYAPALMFFFLIYLIDESPRWLLSKGRKYEAIAIIEKIGDKNKVKIDDDELNNLVYESDEDNVSFAHLLAITFKSRTLFKRFIVCVIWWTTSTFVYYGMTINSVSLQGNKYFNYALISFIDIPGSFLVMYILMKFNRKKPLIISFLTAAAFCITQPFLPNNLPWLSVTMYMAGKFMSSLYFSITYMYTSELFPTYTRNSMQALCSSLGRIGSIIAPQTPLLRVYWTGLPPFIFGIVSLIAGLATFAVPDTANDALPDTVRQAEQLGTKHVVETNRGFKPAEE